MRLALVALSLLAVAGCDSNDGRASRLELVVNQTRFAPGDEALVVLDNDTGKAVSYLPCPSLLSARGQVVEPSSCSLAMTTIGPGQSVPFRVALPETLEPGTYAVVLVVSDRVGQVATGRFEVAPR